MRLVWGLVAALGLLVGAGLAYERFTPPEQVTRPAAPHAAILTGGTAQPALAAEPAPSTPTRLPPAAPAQPDIPSGSILAQPTASVANATRTSSSGAARHARPAAPSAAQVRAEASSAPVAVGTGARPDVARPAATVIGGTRRDIARPTAEPPKFGVPRVSAPTPTPCVLEPPPRYLDTAPRVPEQ